MNNNGNGKKMIVVAILVMVLMVSTIGATFAYFAVSAVNNNVIGGNAATVNLSLDVTKLAPSTTKYNSSTKVYVPQLNSALGTAISSTNSCVDGNNNIVCSVYQITVKNNSSATVVLDGDLTFNFSSTMTNLFWKPLTNATTINSDSYGDKFFKYSSVATSAVAATTTGAVNSKLVSSLRLNPANTANSCTTTVPTSTTSSSTPNSCVATYYVVVWINETNNDQYGADGNRSFYGTVNFEGPDGTGLTSTFTS